MPVASGKRTFWASGGNSTNTFFNSIVTCFPHCNFELMCPAWSVVFYFWHLEFFVGISDDNPQVAGFCPSLVIQLKLNYLLRILCEMLSTISFMKWSLIRHYLGCTVLKVGRQSKAAGKAHVVDLINIVHESFLVWLKFVVLSYQRKAFKEGSHLTDLFVWKY